MPTADTKPVPEVRHGMDGDVKTSEMRVGWGGGGGGAIPRGVHWGIVRR